MQARTWLFVCGLSKSSGRALSVFPLDGLFRADLGGKLTRLTRRPCALFGSLQVWSELHSGLPQNAWKNAALVCQAEQVGLRNYSNRHESAFQKCSFERLTSPKHPAKPLEIRRSKQKFKVDFDFSFDLSQDGSQVISVAVCADCRARLTRRETETGP